MSYNSKYTGAEVATILDSVAGKQEAISDLDTIREGAYKGATALQTEQYKGTIVAENTNDVVDDPDIEYATKIYVDNAIIGAINSSY